MWSATADPGRGHQGTVPRGAGRAEGVAGGGSRTSWGHSAGLEGHGRGWNEVNFEVPPNPTHSVTPEEAARPQTSGTRPGCATAPAQVGGLGDILGTLGQDRNDTNGVGMRWILRSLPTQPIRRHLRKPGQVSSSWSPRLRDTSQLCHGPNTAPAAPEGPNRSFLTLNHGLNPNWGHLGTPALNVPPEW